MNETVTIRGHVTPVNSSELFVRIVCILKNDTKKSKYFQYELAPTPPSLVNGCSIRKTDKSAFSTHFNHTDIRQFPKESTYVIDGGYLLHATCWSRLANYCATCDLYVRHVNTRYPSATVVFDGYYGQQSLKDEEQRRHAARRACFDIECTKNSTSTVSLTDFLANRKNKSRIIDVIKSKFALRGVQVYGAAGDADALLVETALQNEINEKKKCCGRQRHGPFGYVSSKTGLVFVLHLGTSKASGKVFDVDIFSVTSHPEQLLQFEGKQ